MNDTILDTRDLEIGYRHKGRRTAVASGISVSLRAGDLVCLIGPNGVGKSTLIRTIAGMQPPLAGRVTLGGVELHRLRAAELARQLSVVLTDRVNVGVLSAYALVALGRHPYTDWSGRLTARDEEVVRWAIEKVGAAPLAHRSVGELSDGERQKVMIARALAQEPRLLVLDEPTAYLDLPRRVEVMHLLKGLARSGERAILLSTHDLDLALRTADRIWLMSPDGLLAEGAPEDLVLTGAFERAFRSEGVEFDPATGSFAIGAPAAGEVALEGDGLVATWTRRALEREGFRVSDNGHSAEARVEVRSEGPELIWLTRVGAQCQEHRSVHDVLACLKARQALDREE
ncbi:MAG: ABC transporter ATP-binding protein [Anaerolineae bacterium]|nr:ABC transporter ATP-binding protein [Anaerolineae bacterium]